MNTPGKKQMFKSMTLGSALRNQERRASQIQNRQIKGKNTDESGAKWGGKSMD